AALVGGGLVVAGLGLVRLASVGPSLDLFALPVAAPDEVARAARQALAGVALTAVGLTHLLAAPPLGGASLGRAPAPLQVWLAACAPVAAAALGLRLVLSLRAPGGLVVPDVDPGAVLGGAGVLVIAAARLATRREADLGRLVAGQAAAAGGWLLVALAGLGAPGPVDPRPAVLAVTLLAVSAVVGQVAAAALLATADRELGGRGLERWVGAGRRNVWLALALVLTVAHLAGAPGTLGFVARAHTLVGALEGGYEVVALLAALDVALGLVLTLRVARVALLVAPPRPAFGPDAVEPLVTTPGLTVVAVALPLLAVALGLAPAALLRASW
ncbi:MAG: hypothetical protein KF878_11870, partial [Planctomycetes bacterium]|nr:hypothetical protein [Planctomycetota bacterium]